MITVNVESKVSLDDYIPIVGESEVNSVKEKAEKLRGKSVTHINSTSFGGGVAEKIHDMVPLMRAAGLDTNWKVMEGALEFFNVTKKIHNELQGADTELTNQEKDIYLRYNKNNNDSTTLDTDLVVVHDNQPAAIIQFQPERTNKWVWRCHIDMSTPKLTAWNFLQTYVNQYDAAIFTSKKYVLPSFNLPKTVIRSPSINPLCDKNKEISESDVQKIIEKFGVNPEQPIITQVARFDPWKDPNAAIDVYRIVKKEIPHVQLLLVASMAQDDPEGLSYFEKTSRHAGEDKDIYFLTDFKGVNNLEVNAIQRASDVILQMSTREGFGLTVSEALWKQVPVVGRNVGGISLQIINGSNGFLIKTVDEAAKKTLYLLKHKEKAKQMGIYGKELVRKNFLIVNNLKDYLVLFNDLLASNS